MTTVYCTEGGARLDVFLTDETEFTRSHIKNLIDGGKVFIGGVAEVKAGQTVRTGDEVSFEDIVESDDVEPEDIPLDVVYEDNDIAVINKQRGLVVHPGAGNRNHTLVNALLYRFGKVSTAYGAARAGIVHRLDKDTTGLMVVCKTDAAHASVGEQFAAHTVKKLYRAVLDSNLKEDSGTIDAPIGRDKKNRLKMAVVRDGRRAVTDYAVLERYKNNCYVEFTLHTGRTHQIRVHASYMHCPVSCDPLYGGRDLGAAGQLLHAYDLAFDHPTSGERVEFTAPEPPDFGQILQKLRKTSS